MVSQETSDRERTGLDKATVRRTTTPNPAPLPTPGPDPAFAVEWELPKR
jgi:hypothetical protein